MEKRICLNGFWDFSAEVSMDTFADAEVSPGGVPSLRGIVESGERVYSGIQVLRFPIYSG